MRKNRIIMNAKLSQTISRTKFPLIAAAAIGGFGFAGTVHAAGTYFKVEYPASTATNELQIAASYLVWIPEDVKTLRGVIVHQHGAGVPASEEGIGFSYDLHWQALAKKWDCALLSPSYHVKSQINDDAPGNSQLWFDPRRGSEQRFLKALDDLAAQSGRTDLTSAPWVLWGHSGGGIWSDVMATMYPDRVVAMWLRSGSGAMWLGKPRFADFSKSAAVYEIPFMANSGIQEKGGVPWRGPLSTVQDHRAHNGPVGFAPDPLTGHWCGDSRYLAIPYLDAVMALRLPDKGSADHKLKHVDVSKGWLAPLLGDAAVPAADFKGDPKEAVWLPNETIAKDWMEYVKTGEVSDTTPPPAPYNLKVDDRGERGSTLTWEADADFESGIHHFIIMRDGRELGNWPAVNQVRFQERPNFQAGWMNSYGDAPMYPTREMTFEDPNRKDNLPVTYSVIEVNTVGLKSEPATIQTQRRPQRGAGQGGNRGRGTNSTNQAAPAARGQ